MGTNNSYDYQAHIRQQQARRRELQAELLSACVEKWRQNPSEANLKLMKHVNERIAHDEALIKRREWNLKDDEEE